MNRLKSWLILTLSLVGACLLARVCLRRLFVTVTVEGQSMLPALEPGDRVLVGRGWTVPRLLRKGRIVVVRQREPQPAESAAYLIKRITGLPGEPLSIPPRLGRSVARASFDGVVPAEHIFIQGDNPLGSFDSTVYGPIPVEQVLGVVIRKLPRTADDAWPAPAGRSKPRSAGLASGQPAPPFSAETLGGEHITLGHYAGRAVALLFTIPSPICADLIPDYQALQPYARAAGVELVLVWNDEPAQAQRFVERLKPALPMIVAPEQDNPLTQDYRVQLWPSYCLIDAQGVVRSSGHPGGWSDEWRALVESWGAPAARAPQLVDQLGGAHRG